MRKFTIPYATITLALIITIIQVFHSIGGNYDELIWTNLNVVSWELLYSQPWRILTSPFLHHTPLHYLENLGFLLLFGYQIERIHGRVYLLGAFFGALVTGYVVWINLAHNWIIGISGGVCGLFGFSLIANRRAPWWTTLTHRPLHLLYIANLLLAVFIDLFDWVPFEVAHLNHVVGILYGAAFGSAFLLVPRSARWRSAVIALPLLLFASQFYSPWQVEWRLVNRSPTLVSTVTDCRLRSIEQDTYTPAPITILNASKEPIAYYWLDYKGEARFFRWLRPGDSGEVNSFIGHPWCIVDPENFEAIQVFVVTEPDQTFTIP